MNLLIAFLILTNLITLTALAGSWHLCKEALDGWERALRAVQDAQAGWDRCSQLNDDWEALCDKWAAMHKETADDLAHVISERDQAVEELNFDRSVRVKGTTLYKN